MSKVPPILLQKLAQLRSRERLLRLLLGAAFVAALVLVALVAACFVDWLYDLWDDTPFALRTFLLFAQVVLAAAAILLAVVVPQLARLRDSKLALFVEDRHPQLQHRLISALELNQPGAKTEGMSSELLTAVTREAEEHTRPLAFASLADHSRLKRGALVLAPAALLACGLYFFFPDTALALLQRQLLGDIDIPRSLVVESDSKEVWPSGEEVELKFKAHGPGVADQSGTLRIRGNDERSFSVPLVLQSSTAGGDSAIFLARVPPASVNFAYTAKVGDGRMRKVSRVFYVPRPAIIQQDAYLILPSYLGFRPDKTPYEKKQIGGDVVGHPGMTSVRIAVKTQKPIKRAVLEIFGSAYSDLSQPAGLSKSHQRHALSLGMLAGVGTAASSPSWGPLLALGVADVSQAPVVLRTFEQSLSRAVEMVEWHFDLLPTETKYRVVVFDEYGFASKTGTVRALKIEPEPPPVIVMHPERHEADARYKSNSKMAQLLDFEGMPLPVSDNGVPSKMPISYEAFGPFGIGKVELKIRVSRGANDSEGETKKQKIELNTRLPLAEFAATNRPFDKSRGAFVDSGGSEQIFFYPMPSSNPLNDWSRVFAGGRFDYMPAGFLDELGRPFEFKVGDQVVVFLEVYNQNPDPKKALMTKSKLRERDLVLFGVWDEWRQATLREADRIEDLVRSQQQVYDRPWFSIFGFKN